MDKKQLKIKTLKLMIDWLKVKGQHGCPQKSDTTMKAPGNTWCMG